PAGEHLTVAQALVNGLAAGLVNGLIVGGLGALVGTVSAAKGKMSTYLAQLLPDTIQIFLLGQNPAQTFTLYLILLKIAGLLGGLIGFALARTGWRKAIRAGWDKLTSLPVLEKLQGNRAFRPSVNVVLLLVLFLLPLQLSQYWNYTLGTVGIYVLL